MSSLLPDPLLQTVRKNDREIECFRPQFLCLVVKTGSANMALKQFPLLNIGPSQFNTANLGNKPLLRIAAACLTALLLLLTTIHFLVPRPVPNIPITYTDRVDYIVPAPVIAESGKSSSNNHYEALDSIASSNTYSDDPVTEPGIGKVTVLFHSKDDPTARAIKSHEAHNQRFGHPQFVLRHSLIDGGTLDGSWNKPAYILAILLQELRKPEVERLQWLL